MRTISVLDVEILSDTEGFVDLAATLLPTTAEADTLDGVVAALEHSVLVKSATWTVETAA